VKINQGYLRTGTAIGVFHKHQLRFHVMSNEKACATSY